MLTSNKMREKFFPLTDTLEQRTPPCDKGSLNILEIAGEESSMIKGTVLIMPRKLTLQGDYMYQTAGESEWMQLFGKIENLNLKA